jgi:phosphonate transport system substrate-binding protein
VSPILSFSGDSRLIATLAIVWVLLGSCGSDEAVPGESPREVPGPEKVLTLGDIEVDEPGKRIRRLRPLADFLAAELAPLGISRVDVILARDIQQLADLMSRGEVDVYLDSPFPTVRVQARSNSRVILRRWVGTDSEYHTVYITRSDSGIGSLEDLVGRVVGFQDRTSTSAFFLPALELVERGFALESVGSAEKAVAAERIGIFFTGDEENTASLLRLGGLDAGVLSHQDYGALPADLRKMLPIIDRTPTAPRALVSVRGDLDTEMEAAVREVLLNIDERDRQAMAAADPGRGWTWRFGEISSEVEAGLERMRANLSKVTEALEVESP